MTAGCAYLHFSRLCVISSLVQRSMIVPYCAKSPSASSTRASLPRLSVDSPGREKNPFFTPFAFYTVDFVSLKWQLWKSAALMSHGRLIEFNFTRGPIDTTIAFSRAFAWAQLPSMWRYMVLWGNWPVSQVLMLCGALDWCSSCLLISWLMVRAPREPRFTWRYWAKGRDNTWVDASVAGKKKAQ